MCFRDSNDLIAISVALVIREENCFICIGDVERCCIGRCVYGYSVDVEFFRCLAYSNSSGEGASARFISAEARK